MTICFVEEAQSEFLDAITSYEEARARLGRKFKEQVDRSVGWIADSPELYRLRPGGFRRINVRMFPYYIPYVVSGQTLLGACRGAQQSQARVLDCPAARNRLCGRRQLREV